MKIKQLFITSALLLAGTISLNAQSNCQGRTYTQGGWGAACNGGNPGCYLNANFATAFPGGLTIGCLSNNITFSTALDIQNFLPAGGTATSLPATNNVLLGQLVALKLNVVFDASNANFSPSAQTLGNYVITSGVFNGMTVSQFLQVAENVIGGCSNAYSFSDINSAATAINQNYDNGTTDAGFLSCCNVVAQANASPILCNGGTSNVTVTATGGNNTYTGTGVFNVSAGTHVYYVNDGGGCTASVTIVVTQPNALFASAQAGNILCNGGSTSVFVSAIGGTPPYASTGNFTATAGSYTYTVTDNNGCSSIANVNITEPTVLNASSSNGNILCNGGATTVQVSANGGTAPYTGEGVFNANAGAYSYTVTDGNGCTAVTGGNITEPTLLEASSSNGNIACHGGTTNVNVSATGGTSPYTGTGNYMVSAGGYSYEVVDANGCIAYTNGSVEEPALLVSSANAGNIACFGGTTAVNVSATGGTAPYTGTGNFNVSAGSYTYNVTDNNGCTASIPVVITQPAQLSMTTATSLVMCYGGVANATAFVNGGTTPYSIVWNSNPSQEGSMAALMVGSYTVNVTDANGCTVSGNVKVSLASCTGFKTITMGGWGAGCNGGNWGCYRNTNFAAAFPNGLILGAGTRMLRLTSASAIQAFLPSSGTPGALPTGTLVNPTKNQYSNTLAGQTAALKLNVRFDEFDANFSPATAPFAGLVITSGTFQGWTVTQILAEADKILGGQASAYTASQVNAQLNAINLNYDNGTVNQGVLACACSSSSRYADNSSDNTVIETAGVSVAGASAFSSFPNPASTSASIFFAMTETGYVTVKVYNISGQQIASLFEGTANENEGHSVALNAEALSNGLYFVVLSSQKGSETHKIMISK